MGLLAYLHQIEKTLDSCLVKGNELMALVDTMRAKFIEIDQETTRIGLKIDELVAKLAAGGMTEEQEAEVLASLTSHADRLKQVGTDAPTA